MSINNKMRFMVISMMWSKGWDWWKSWSMMGSMGWSMMVKVVRSKR